MTDTTISDAVVFPQDLGTGVNDGDEDYNSAGYYAVLSRYKGDGSYVGEDESGNPTLQFGSIDTTNEQADVQAGYAYIMESSVDVQGGSQATYNRTLPTNVPYVVALPTSVTLSLDTDVENDVWLAVDPTANDSVYIRHGSGLSAPSDPSVKLGTVNTSDGTTGRANDLADSTQDSVGVNELTGNVTSSPIQNFEGTNLSVDGSGNLNSESTSHSVSNDGSEVVTEPTDVNFGSNVTANDDGDGTVTITATDTNTDTRADAQDNGSTIVQDVTAFDFGNDLNVSNNNDGTVTIDSSASGGGTAYTVNPDNFGAAGDGSTDDSQAFQDAINSATASDPAILELTPGNHYYLGSTVNVDVNLIRAIEGNGAYIVLDSSITGLNVFGDKTSSGSNPSSGNNSTHAENEMGTHIRNLQAYSTNYSGTALNINDTFATIVTDCNFAKMNNAIEFSGINRNLIIANNHIWDTANYGLYFNAGDFHQILVADNYVQWAYKVVYINNGDLADFLFSNNNFETGNNEQNGSQIVFDAEMTSSTANMWNILIEGNNFDGHNGTNTGIRMTATAVSDENLSGIRIVNNYISQFASEGILLNEMNQVTISNNHGERNNQVLTATGSCKAITFTDNVWQNLRGSASTSGIVYTTDSLVTNWTIADNQFVDWNGQAIVIDDSSTSANNRSEIKILNNNVHLTTDASSLTGYIIDIDTSATFNNVTVKGNTVRGRDVGEGGIRVRAGSYNTAIMKDNAVRGISSGTPFISPDGTVDGVIVHDNITDAGQTGAANYFVYSSTEPNNPSTGMVWIDTS